MSVTRIAVIPQRQAYRIHMVTWCSPLAGSASTRDLVVTRRRAELVVTLLLFCGALAAVMQGLGSSASWAIGFAALWFASPALRCLIRPIARCGQQDLRRRMIAIAARACRPHTSADREALSLTVASVATTVHVAIASAIDRVVLITAGLLARLHGVPHHCALRTRLTTAIAAGC